MQTPTERGLEPSPEAERRCTIIPIHNANEATKSQLVDMWAKSTPEEAKNVLSRPDVQVTRVSERGNNRLHSDTPRPSDMPTCTCTCTSDALSPTHVRLDAPLAQVTNQSDKDTQLDKLLALLVRRLCILHALFHGRV